MNTTSQYDPRIALARLLVERVVRNAIQPAGQNEELVRPHRQAPDNRQRPQLRLVKG